VERTELHFLMEAALQMYRWASVPSTDPENRSWTDRRLLYDLPSMEDGEWIKTLRDLLVHFDETYRGIEGRAVKAAKTRPPRLEDVPQLETLAQRLMHALEEVFVRQLEEQQVSHFSE
jgi:hypothetical protein